MTDAARAGIYTYKDSTGVIRTVDVLGLAAQRGWGSREQRTQHRCRPRPDQGSRTKDGALTSRIGTNNDYNRLDYQFQDPVRTFGGSRRSGSTRTCPPSTIWSSFTTTNTTSPIRRREWTDQRISRHRHNRGASGRYRICSPNTFSFVAAHRWTINDRLINEIRATSSGNALRCSRRSCSGSYDFWAAMPSRRRLPQCRRISQPHQPSRRNTPVKGLTDNITTLQGAHTLNLGFAFTRVASFTQSVSTQVVPQISFGLATGDPVNTGGTSIFTTGNFPNSSSAQRTEAGNLYALLTGRISAISRQATLNEKTRAYEFIPFTERNHQNEFAFYAQDAWKARPDLTFNYGLRWEFEPSALNDNQVYTRTDSEGIFGVSGDGNLFKPGVFAGKPTQFRLLQSGESAFRTRHKDFAPSWVLRGVRTLRADAWQDRGNGNQTVLRGGYSIAYTAKVLPPLPICSDRTMVRL